MRQGDHRLVGDLRPGGGVVDNEDKRLSRFLGQIHRPADGPKVMRTGPGGDQYEVRYRDHLADRRRDRRGRVDDQKRKPQLTHALDIVVKLHHGGLHEDRRVRHAIVPPFRQTPLRVGIDQGDGAGAHPLRLDGDVARQRRLADAALLRCNCQDSHRFLAPFRPGPAPGKGPSAAPCTWSQSLAAGVDRQGYAPPQPSAGYPGRQSKSRFSGLAWQGHNILRWSPASPWTEQEAGGPISPVGPELSSQLIMLTKARAPFRARVRL